MSLLTCFANAAKMGVITGDEAKEFSRRYTEMLKDGVGSAQARDRMAQQIKAEADQRRRAALLTNAAIDRILLTLDGYTDDKGRKDRGWAWVNSHENMGDRGSFIQDAEGRREAINRSTLAEMKDILREFRRGAFRGDLRRTTNKAVVARAENIVREIHGVHTGDAKAKAMAAAWTASAEKLRTRFNDAGGAIGKLQGGYLPQSHNALALLDFGKLAWVDHLMDPAAGRLDRKRMVDGKTNQPLTDTQLREALEKAWERIVTDGYYDADVTAQPKGPGALYTQHADHRFIHFASPDHYLDYSRRFGNGGDVFAAMMAHISVMSRDIAHMEVFGPNPNRTREFIKQTLIKDATNSGDPKLLKRTARRIRLADRMWENMRGGQVDDPDLAARAQSVRNVITAGALPAAWISSLNDPAFGQDMRLRMGMGIMKSNVFRVFAATFGEMITMGKRDDIVAAGIGLDGAMRVLHKKVREQSVVDHRFWTGYVADRVLTTGMLLPWGQAGKAAFSTDMMRWVASISDNAWGNLPDAVRRGFEKNGIGASEWEKLRVVPKHQGVLLRPTEVIAVDRMLGERYLQAILRNMRHAIPEGTVHSQSVLDFGNAGSGGGELWRMAMQFKSFGVAVIMLHTGRIARELGAADHRASAAGHAATLFITSTVLAMVAMALKDTKDGRDPRRWLDEKTWLDPNHVGEAILQAGGLGIYGDFIRSSGSRIGGGLAGAAAGPFIGKVENLATIVNPRIQASRLMAGKETTSAEEAVRFFRSGVVPNHWALQLVFQRAVMDRMQRLVDADAQRAFNRQISQRQREYGQQFWWQPGTTAPQRRPDWTRPLATR